MIDLHYWPTPNGHKITLFLEEAEVEYRVVPVNIGKGEQFAPDFSRIAPNNRMPAIVDHAPADGGDPISIFESAAILLYLADKTGKFGGTSQRARIELLQWLMWQMGGLGPMAGQNHHFNLYAPEKLPYAMERYVKETNRLYGVLDRRLADRAFIAGEDYSIADMACYPWTVPHEAQGQRLEDTPNLKRWFEAIAARPATKAAYAKGDAIRSLVMIDEEKRILSGETAASPAREVIARGARSALHFVVLTVLIDAIGFGIVMPVLPSIVMELGHMGLAEATRIGGWLGVLYAAVQFFTGPLIGNLGDRFGRRPILLGALGGFAIDYALMGFAPRLWWLFVGRALAGLFGSCFGPAAAVIADISAPGDRARGYGMMGAAFGIGFVIGPAVGGLLAAVGPRAPFYAAAAFAALNFLFGLSAFPETFPPALRRRFEWRRANPIGALLSLRDLPGILPLAFVTFWWNLASMVYPVTWSFFALAAFGWAPGTVGLSLAMVGALMAASQIFLVGRVVRAIGERRAATLGILVATLQFACYAVLRDGRAVFLILCLMPIQSLVMPSLGALGSRRVPADRQGELQGFSGSVGSIAAIAAPALFNPALAYFTGASAPFYFVGAPFVLAAGAALVALAGLAFVARRDRQIPPATVS